MFINFYNCTFNKFNKSIIQKDIALFRSYFSQGSHQKSAPTQGVNWSVPLDYNNINYSYNIKLVSNLNKVLPLVNFRQVILSYYWRILSYYNQFRKLTSFSSRLMSLKTITSRFNSRSDRVLRLNFLFVRPRRLLRLRKRERNAWKNYIMRFRIWYDMYRFLYTKKLPNHIRLNSFVPAWYNNKETRASRLFKSSSSDTLNITQLGEKLLSSSILTRWLSNRQKSKNPIPMGFSNLFYDISPKIIKPWRSRKFWSMRALSSLFRKKAFFKRFFTFRLERIRKRKHFKRRRKTSFLSYSHERFHKLRLFYTTLGYRQFQNLFKRLQYFKKNAASLIASVLELRLEFFLYRVNFAPSKYFAKQFLAHNTFTVNNKVISNKNYLLSVGDVVGVVSSRFALIFNLLLSRFYSMKRLQYSLKKTNPTNMSLPVIFLNPGFSEVDYSLLRATIYRNPVWFDVFVPLYIELDPYNRTLPQIYNSYL